VGVHHTPDRASIKFRLPADHVPAMIVDKQRGARCTTCKFFIGPDRCGNKFFVEASWPETKLGPAKPAGSDLIPYDPDSYCSDWYEIQDNAMKAQDCIGIHTHTPVNAPEVIRAAQEMEARDYIAVDARGHRVWGPGRDYVQAKQHADRAGGVVQWIPAEANEEDVFGRSIRWSFDGHMYQGTGRKGDYLIVPSSGPNFIVYGVTVDAHGGINKTELGASRNHVDAMDLADQYDLGEIDVEAVPSTKRERTPTPPAVVAEARETVPVIYEEAGEPSRASKAQPVVYTQGDCLPWVRVTRDPERYKECLSNARKIGPIDNARKVYDLLSPALSKEDQEVMCVVMLDVRRHIRGVSEVHRGQRSRVSVAVSDVMRVVIASGAEAFIVAHNHPSSNATPSSADIRLTKSIQEACRPFGKDITFLGHVVIGQGFVEITPEGNTSKLYKA
jgi:DNA repair protein RadC